MATEESNPCENLPQDLINEILLRLPVKSLLKFRCVSKSWLSLISSPEFKTTYLQVSTSRQRLIFGGSATALYTCSLSSIFDEHPSVDDAPFDFASDDPYDSIQIVGSCKGLVCLVFRRTRSIILWNPAIRKYRQLPFPLKNNSWICYGFGYDASSDDYKVVQIDHGLYASDFSTYSLRNNSWKLSDWSHGTTFGSLGVFMNGAIHWIVGHDDNDIGWAVVVQSLAMDQIFSSFALPVHPDECERMSAFLGVSGERLCAYFDRGFSIDVWVMEEYGVKESWRKVVCIPKDDYNLAVEPLLVTEKGVVLMKVVSKLMAQIQFEYRKIIKLSDDTDATATIYAESFVVRPAAPNQLINIQQSDLFYIAENGLKL